MSTGVALANGLSGIIAAAVFATLEGKLGAAGYQWLFIILALLGASFAVVASFLLPDYPHSTTGSAMWTMTEDMRRIAQAGIIADRVSVAEAKGGVWYGLKLALADYKLWLMGVRKRLYRYLGHDLPPPYALAAISAIAIAWSSDRRTDRGWHFSVPVAVGMAGYVVCMATTNKHARYATLYLYIGGLFGANPLINTWLTGIIGRTPEKRATALVVNSILGQVGNVIAPYFFVDSDEPRYLMAFILMFVMAGLCIPSAMALKFSLWRENKKLRREALQNGTAYQPYIQWFTAAVETASSPQSFRGLASVFLELVATRAARIRRVLDGLAHGVSNSLCYYDIE